MTVPGPSNLRRAALVGAARFVMAAAVFGAAQFLATDVIGAERMPLALVIVATGVVAVVFWASAPGLQRLVDRLLFGEHAGGFEAGRALLQRMATTLPVDDILPALAETAGRTTHSARAEVRVLLSDGEPWSQVWPPRAVGDGSAPLTIGVRHAGTDVGEIEVDPTDADESDRDRVLLDDLARPAGLALNTVRLTVELRRRAQELQTLTEQLELSNDRIVQARRSEIDRLRGEMQQRVMPHIDRAGGIIETEVAAVQTVPGTPSPTASSAEAADPGALDRALAEVADALESLRTLARGIYPPRLADAGLAVSVEGWQQRSGIGVDLRMLGNEDLLHRHTDIESCLYFSLVTVLAAIGADGARPAATVTITAAWVEALVTGTMPDASLDANVHSAALQAVRDRVEAFDGQLVLTEPASTSPGTGSGSCTVLLRLPLRDATGSPTEIRANS